MITKEKLSPLLSVVAAATSAFTLLVIDLGAVPAKKQFQPRWTGRMRTRLRAITGKARRIFAWKPVLRAAVCIVPIAVLDSTEAPALDTFGAGSIEVFKPVASAATEPLTAVGYFTVRNSGAKADELLRIESDFASDISLRETVIIADAVLSHTLPSLEIPAEDTVFLSRPSAYVFFATSNEN